MRPEVRHGDFDVVVLAGPRVHLWPSIGVQTLSQICSQMGLSVGIFGGDSIFAKGVIPLPSFGGIVLLEDAQKRVHRIRAKAVVKVSADLNFPDPFPGWYSEGLIPLSTARQIRKKVDAEWSPGVAVLGTGNAALRFGSDILEHGTDEVYCIETQANWKGKRFAGWEVEKRRFETLGGKFVEAQPVGLTKRSPLIWDFRVKDTLGVRILTVSRVISAGPYDESPGWREFPPGSLLFEMDQSSMETLKEDPEGWASEKERGRWLGSRIVRRLVADLGENKSQLDRTSRRARTRLKRFGWHREHPFTPAFEGKWISKRDRSELLHFIGVPQKDHFQRKVASLECFEDIQCNLCEKACPEKAIKIDRSPKNGEPSFLIESKCTACGACLQACPSRAAVMIHEKEDQSYSELTLPIVGPKKWKEGDFVKLVNRKGEGLGNARVKKILSPEAVLEKVPEGEESDVSLIEVEVPSHLLWEARGIRSLRQSELVDDTHMGEWDESIKRVEITLDGEKRLVRENLKITAAFFETGRARPGDILFCPDGTCGLCEIMVDGVKRLACQNKVRNGTAIRLVPKKTKEPTPDETLKKVMKGTSETTPEDDSILCPCLGVTKAQVLERLKHGKLSSPEAVQSVTHVGKGRCHGQICSRSFKRLLQQQGLDTNSWIDWGFPWMDWTFASGSKQD